MNAPLELTDPDGVAALVGAGFRDVADFPRPGVGFKDLSPLLADPVAFGRVVDVVADLARAVGASAVAGIEARGFMLAAPVALAAGVAFWPVRKAGKLPPPVLHRAYDLEYGSAAIELSTTVVGTDDRVLLVDDVLATGGTARAAAELVEEAGASVAGIVVLLELGFLGGRSTLGERPVVALRQE